MILNELLNIENATNLDYRILSCLAVLLTLSALLLVMGIKRFLQGKLISASAQSLSGVFLLLSGLFFLSVATNLYSYDRLTYEKDIAELTFSQLGKQKFRVDITYPDRNKTNSFMINGDAWQLDARVIKWHGWAQLAGLNAQYRLERISGRYSDIDDERQKPRSVYSLEQKDNIDYWKLINNYKKWLPWIDAHYGSATYLPMEDKVTYAVSLTQSGLMARTAQE
ncbi:MAG: hypothetical protein DHS20C09_15350 [marine bacterium B5-7]|nr:MAG: hypothetical protein DHS20C09_15350 [marine bacterium B5-7]